MVKFNIFELGIFFNSYAYYLTRGFIASTRAFSLQLVDLNSQLVTRVLLFHVLYIEYSQFSGRMTHC